MTVKYKRLVFLKNVILALMGIQSRAFSDHIKQHGQQRLFVITALGLLIIGVVTLVYSVRLLINYFIATL